MESCVSGQWDRVGPVEVSDIRRDLLRDFTDLPPQERSESQVENLQVYLRVRPLTAAESSAHTQDCVTLEGPDTAVLKAPRISQSNKPNDKPLPQTAQRFTFTQVFGPDSGQKTVFDGSVRSSVRDVLDGGNCLVFTYGVTNAGKTFTFLGPEHDSGLLPRSLAVIFNSIEGRLYGRCDLKPQRCRDFSRLTPDQLAAETSSKKNLLRLLKESDRSATFSRSTFLDGSLGSDSSGVSEADSFCLDVESNVRFSVWVSFCEIYNDNIHDLLEQVPSGHHKRTVLRLSQDVKGNSFIKDLRWVQVNSSEEAYRVMKIGKKNQSFSSTRLNHLSSRSHSIFSIRILRVDDVGVPRVLGISELVLCDLAGSERCSRTQNTGERLKEAGNINNSLLTLGKCLHAMRQNQNAKFQHHVPFRESKLTHFLQFFFCGAGRVSMVVNINQNAACYDETLNVLKFSSLAQKVVVLSSRPPVLDDAPRRSALEVSMIIDEADQRRDVLGRRRKSSLVAWETSLEDVLEDEDGEEWDEEEEEEEEESVMEGTVLEAGGEEEEQEEEERTMEEEPKQADGAALRLLLEAQIREEVSNEFMELFTSMEKDYRERLEKEKEILEERADRRFEILKNLGEELTSHHVRSTGGEEEQEERRKRQRDEEEEEERGEPAKKRVVLEEEIWRLNVENNKKEETIVQLRERGERMEEELRRREEEVEKERSRVEEELRRREEEVEELKKEQKLKDECPGCASLFASLQSDQRESCRLMKENKALINGMFQLQTQVTELQKQLIEQTGRSDSLSEQLDTSKTRLQELESQSEEKTNIVKSLTQEVGHLRQEVKEGEGQSSSVFHASMEQLKKESEAALQRSAQTCQLMEELQREKSRLEETLTHSEKRCERLTEELANQKAEFSHQLQSLRAELESEGRALRGGLELESEGRALRGGLEERRGDLLEETLLQTKIVRQELERLKENLLEEENLLEKVEENLEEEKENLLVEEKENLLEKEEENLLEKEKENLLEEEKENLLVEEEENLQKEEEEENLQRKEQVDEERTVSVVEELKQELQRVQGRSRRSREFEAVKREMERLKETKTQSVLRSGGRVLNPEQDVPVSSLRSNMADRKRKSSEVQDLVFSENKRNRLRTNKQNQEQKDGTLQKIGDLIQNSPSRLRSKAKTIIGLVSGHPVGKETVTTATKETVTTATKLRRGRRKLFQGGVTTPLLDSPQMSAVAEEEKESDHLIIKRQLRSKTCRK